MTVGRELDWANQPVYRGGKDLKPKPGEIKIVGGLVFPTRGLSLNRDPANLPPKAGPPHRLVFVPPELEIVQQGRNPNHYELRPKVPLPLEQFLNALEQVVLEPLP